ncbi:UPF0496 protein At4g34320-like [Cornus florida]|uniref:UPF0496 protein At4g34320-like n=1 Tax=Cornus florida TaxID=4283 RepID=UPI002898D0E1|nr:UPF0496 protein At4g34320-like [Cornus florida]
MGSHPSKNPTEQPSTAINIQYTTDLSSYEDACRLDTDLQSFDTTLQSRTSHVLNTLAAGVEVRAVSFDSLKQVTECLLDMNQEVVRVILECKDLGKTQELFDLVQEYFENSLQTLDFCTALEKCLKGARNSQLLILVALQYFEEEDGVGRGGNRYTRTLEELKKFKAAGDPFTEEFFETYQSVYRQQMQMLEKLQLRRNRLDKKLKHVRAWRKVSSVIFAATLAAVLICSVVAAAMAPPPVAAALTAATSIPLGSMGKWIDSLFKKYEDAVKGQEIISSMQVGTRVAIKDLDNIRVLIDRLEIEIESLLQNAEFTISEESVKNGIEEMKKKLRVFMKYVEDLGVQADTCSRDIVKGRTLVLQRIIRQPNH